MNKAQALIVEDSSILGIYFSKVLADADYEVEIMADGQDAVAWLQENVPDLLLLDLNIPRISGEKVLAYIRADERFANTRTLIISGSATRARQVREKVDFVLHKPIEYRQLHRLSKVFHPYYQSTHIFSRY
jgi:chemosensory pili system protein ChpA (sensor histidine kinase/response regulator)